ncbi:MAG: hypothetical protein CDV28_1486 [Candidatus Electronema aureum]|uniref:Uncharacterized protein n=1 Tax=Candidatus Electronema aureum TaxID=2005002 RepID=A0A521FYU9_9BACT|nr:MAG: hypothetical protein CDV28_1486 [Candidatus Electronema aureum]
MVDFLDIIYNCPSSKPLLPLAHTTKSDNLDSIVMSGLKKDSNKGVGLFFYYGLPFFIINERVDFKKNPCSVDISFSKPMGLLVKSDAIKYAKKIYPFDSGGYKKFRHLLNDDSIILQNFEIKNEEYFFNKEVPSKIVTRYFSNNKGYVNGNSTANFNTYPYICSGNIDNRDQLLDRLYKSEENEQADWRKRAIEVLIHQDIDFEYIEVIILSSPIHLPINDDFNRKISKFNVKIIYYDEDEYDSVPKDFGPKNDYILLHEKVKNYLSISKKL